VELSIYTKLQVILGLIYALLLTFDAISLVLDAKDGFQGSNTYMKISEILLMAMSTLICIGYIVLFVMYLRLFKKSKGALDSLKCQIITFFLTTITMLTLRLVLHWVFFAIDT
jgi:hypothetical protein